jgi:hypothetical protein
MAIEHDLHIWVDGPEVDDVTHEHRYTVHSTEREMHFSILPEEAEGREGWCVRIEGVPAPSIAHSVPWPSVDEAREAALAAVEDILQLERVQREDAERQ